MTAGNDNVGMYRVLLLMPKYEFVHEMAKILNKYVSYNFLQCRYTVHV